MVVKIDWHTVGQLRQGFCAFVFHYHAGQARIVNDKAAALGRRQRINDHVRGPRFQYPENGHQGLWFTKTQHTNPAFHTDSTGAQLHGNSG